jgi:laccase
MIATQAYLLEHVHACVQVSQINMTHLCKEMPVTVVNGQLPGPAIEVTEGDTVAVHIVNLSPYNITIHW